MPKGDHPLNLGRPFFYVFLKPRDFFGKGWRGKVFRIVVDFVVEIDSLETDVSDFKGVAVDIARNGKA